MMKWMSLFGLLALVLIAWAMSYHRSKVPFRTIFWGLGLQFLLAVTILQQSYWSFLGMSALSLIIISYIFKELLFPLKANTAAIFIGGLAASVALTFGLLKFLSGGLLFFLILIALIVNGRFFKHSLLQKSLGALLLIALVTTAVVNNLYGQIIFKQFSDAVARFLDLSFYGAAFLFGNLVNGAYFFPDTNTWPGFGFQFAFKVLPTIIFFGGFMSILYYLGIMQKVILAMARFMQWTMGTSGAETLSCSANIFVGQTEAPLLIKPFIKDMTESELLTIMVGGFATIAGGVLAGYIAMGVDAGHLVAASVMSAPAALVIGKIIFPETEHSNTAGDMTMPELPRGQNVIDAASSGISDGLKLAVNVGAMLVGFIALIAVLDVIFSNLDKWIDGMLLGGKFVEYATQSELSPVRGEYSGIFPGSLKTLFATILRPLAFLMGVPWEDAGSVGNLLGIKLTLNEFVAFGTLGNYIQNGVISERAIVISTYAICGFANFSSIGIQIGGISALAPERRGALSKVALKAMFGGAIASWTTATVAGILI
jgi:concentrative nucleoside transporter, CNT family